jgi:hypothetical protein
MRHKPKRTRLLLLYATLVAAMGYSGWQLQSASAQEDWNFEMETSAGVCCNTSASCPGTDLCFLPDKRAACCDSSTAACGGPNYCQRV